VFREKELTQCGIEEDQEEDGYRMSSTGLDSGLAIKQASQLAYDRAAWRRCVHHVADPSLAV